MTLGFPQGLSSSAGTSLPFVSRVNRKTCLWKIIANHSISLALQLDFIPSHSPQTAYLLLLYVLFASQQNNWPVCQWLGDYTCPIAPKSRRGSLPCWRVPLHHLHVSTLRAMRWCPEHACASPVLSAKLGCRLGDLHHYQCLQKIPVCVASALSTPLGWCRPPAPAESWGGNR